MAIKNVTIVYHVESGEPRMVIVDANNLNDPAWHPEGHAHIPVDVNHYNSMKGAQEFHNHMISEINRIKSTNDDQNISS